MEMSVKITLYINQETSKTNLVQDHFELLLIEMRSIAWDREASVKTHTNTHKHTHIHIHTHTHKDPCN